jgi:hypothetical protein
MCLQPTTTGQQQQSNNNQTTIKQQSTPYQCYTNTIRKIVSAQSTKGTKKDKKKSCFQFFQSNTNVCKK